MGCTVWVPGVCLSICHCCSFSHPQQHLDHLWHHRIWQSIGSSYQQARMPGFSNGFGGPFPGHWSSLRNYIPEAGLPLLQPPQQPPALALPMPLPDMAMPLTTTPPGPLQLYQSLHMAMPTVPTQHLPFPALWGSVGICGGGVGGPALQMEGG